MMISPEIYYENNLKNKSYDHIEKEIKALNENIEALEYRIKNHNNNDIDFHIDPSPETRLSMYKKYLEEAIKALENFNEDEYEKYKSSKITNFNENIANIEKIEFIEGGYLTGNDIRLVEIMPDHIVMHIDRSYNEFRGWDKITKKDFPYNKDVFLEKLRSLNLGAWENDYTNDDIVDGTQWDLKISYNNGIKPFLSGGSNAFPDNYEEFIDLMAMDYSK